MKIKFWGCRGSLPIPGKNTLKYGGNTTCIEVRLDDGTLIIFNAGTGIRNLGKLIMKDEGPEEIFLYLMNPNWDMLMGFPFFEPAYHKSFKINMRGGPIAKETIKSYLEHQMEPPFFPSDLSDMKAEFEFSHGIPIVKFIEELEIIPIPLNHPNGGFGFKLRDKEKTAVFLINNELDFDHKKGKTYLDYLSFCQDADLVISDAYYTLEEYKQCKGLGHSTYSDATNMVIGAKAKKLGLICFHPDHTDDVIDRMTGVCREIIKRRHSSLQCFAAMEGAELII